MFATSVDNTRGLLENGRQPVALFDDIEISSQDVIYFRNFGRVGENQISLGVVFFSAFS